MRCSASKSHKEGNASGESSKLKASGEKTESLPDKFSKSEALNPSNDTMDDAYTILLSYSEPEENMKVATNITFKNIIH